MNAAYRPLLAELIHQGVEETNARTGVATRLLQGARAFQLNLINGRLPVPSNRRYFPHIAAAEVAWQLLGTTDPSFIMEHAPKIWGKFLEPAVDPKNPMVLKTAYGYRWAKHFGRDQLALAVSELIDNPTNRQLYISAWDPSVDGLGGPQPKNIPCPVGFTLSRFRDELHMSVLMRSSDAFVGLPYDVMGYALMLDAIAASTGCRPATLTFTLAHVHIYEPHWALNLAAISGGRVAIEGASTIWPIDCEPNLPGWSLTRISADPHGYVEIVKLLAKRVAHNTWNPAPELVI